MYYNPWYSSRSCYGPSPLIPFLLILGLSLVIFWDALSEWYEYMFEVKESLQSNVTIIIFVAFFVLMFLFGFITDMAAIIIPVGIVMVMLPFLHDITVVLVLLVANAFLGIYYYQPQKLVSNGWGQSQPMYYPGTSHSYDRNEPNLGLGLSSSLLCYVVMLSCLFLCITYYDDKSSQWVCLALVSLVVLYFSFGFGDRRSTYPVKKTGLYSWNWNWNWLQPSYRSRTVGSYDRRDFDSGFGLSLGLFCYLTMLVCIFLCMVLCDNDVYWCFSLALVLLIVLYFNFSESEIKKRH